MNIDDEIQKFINNLRTEYKIPAFAYNQHDKFIAGVTPIYYSGPYFDDKEIIAAVKSILVGKWMSSGESVREFEKAFSKKTKNLFSCMVNSGSSANLIMLAALKKYFNWKDGIDEIIVSPVGFPTTISAITLNNLKPVFVDIELRTLNFDVTLIEEKVTSNTKAIFVSPVLGNPPNISLILDICKKHNLQLILDNCDSLGSKWNGFYLNEFAVSSSCSFYAAHEICTFEGGMISTNNREIDNIIRSMVNWGRKCICRDVENLLPNGICNHRFDTWLKNYDGIVDHKYVFGNMGYNLKPLEMSGAVGVVQIEKLDEICKNRKDSKNKIQHLFQKYIKNISHPFVYAEADPTPFGTAIICKTKDLKNRLVSHLEKNKIQTRNYFAGNLLLHEAYEKLDDYKKYSNSNTVLDTVFFVGASPSYTQETFDYIESVLQEFKNE